MAAKKAPAKPSQRDLTARICGCLAGTSDHIARLQQEITDIQGRCQLALEFSEHMPRSVISEEDRKFFKELSAYCDTRFGNLFDMRKRIELVLVEANKYKPAS